MKTGTRVPASAFSTFSFDIQQTLFTFCQQQKPLHNFVNLLAQEKVIWELQDFTS
jgi:hypothetical protein